jgi:uncharacterized HAD superfamily protein
MTLEVANQRAPRLTRSRLRLGIDLDGVVADFPRRYMELANQLYSLNLKPENQTSWALTCLGLTDEQDYGIWKTIKRKHNFWMSLEKYPDTDDLNLAQLHHTLFFITSRAPSDGHTLEVQCAQWLGTNYSLTCPTVIVVESWRAKPALVETLKIHAFLDDNPETVAEMLSCKQNAYIQDRVYNRQFDYPRAKNVNEFLKTVEEQFGRSS